MAQWLVCLLTKLAIMSMNPHPDRDFRKTDHVSSQIEYHEMWGVKAASVIFTTPLVSADWMIKLGGCHNILNMSPEMQHYSLLFTVKGKY